MSCIVYLAIGWASIGAATTFAVVFGFEHLGISISRHPSAEGLDPQFVDHCERSVAIVRICQWARPWLATFGAARHAPPFAFLMLGTVASTSYTRSL